MANEFMASADGLSNSFINSLWTDSGSATVVTNIGLFGEPAFSVGASGFLRKTLTAKTTRIVGWRMRVVNQLPPSTTTLLAFHDAGNTQTDLRLLVDGTLQITRNGTVLDTTSYALNANGVYHIEFKVTINNTTGSAEIRVDGNVKKTLTNVNTRATANNNANSVRWGGATSMHVWDMYINDDLGGVNDGYWGPARIVPHFPNAAGDINQWLASGGSASANNYQEVDDNPPNTADYVQSDTPNDEDLYNVENLKVPGTILAVQLGHLMRTEGGATNVKQLLKSGATTDASADKPLSGSYLYYLENYDVDPDTMGAWDEAIFNAVQVGQRKT